MKNLLKLSVVAMFGMVAVACAGDTVEDNSTGAEQELEQSGSSGSGTSTSGGAETSGGESSGGNSCGPSSVNKDDPCEVCVVSNCAMLALACCNKTGCMDIIDCAQETQCDGIECYSTDTCKDVIDAAGGADIALNYAQPLGDCALEKCAAECGG